MTNPTMTNTAMTNPPHPTQDPIIWALPAQYALVQSLHSSLALGLFVPGILMAYRPQPVRPSPAER